MGEQVNRWPARLHVVTGKGGTGKTSVAAALALGLAASFLLKHVSRGSQSRRSAVD